MIVKCCKNQFNYITHRFYLKFFFSIPGLICIQIQYESTNFVGGSGLDICDEGQVKGPRGECITAYTFIPPKEEEDIKKREIKKPTRRRNLKQYLRSKYKF